MSEHSMATSQHHLVSGTVPEENSPLWRRLVEMAPFAVQLYSKQGIWVWSNAAARTIPELRPSRQRGGSLLDNPELSTKLLRALSGALMEPIDALRERVGIEPVLAPIESTAGPHFEAQAVPMRDEAGEVRVVAVIWHEMPQMHPEEDFGSREVDILREDALAQIVRTDPLTGLANRLGFQQSLDNEMARALRTRTELSVLVVDLDHFREICNTHGHRAGDEVLVQIAQAIRREVLRGSDVVARLGGDEFSISLPETPAEGAVHVADRILQTLSAHPVVLKSGTELRITATIGLATAPDHAETTEDLLSAVETAMYEAKARGRNRRLMFDPSFADKDAQMSRWTEARGRILPGLLDGTAEFFPYFQPIVDLDSGLVVAHEALARCRTADGVQSAGEFIASAEHFGLISKIDRTMLHASLDVLIQAHRNGHSASAVSVNLSALDMQHESLIQEIQDKLIESDLPRGSLILEITETAAIHDLEQAQRFISALRELGAKIALDDFGAGYTSLPTLKHLDLDLVKLDISFIRNLDKSPADRKLVKALNEMAHSLGVKTVAEGVETKEIYEIVMDLGVDRAQGYWIARPQAEWREIHGLPSRLSSRS